MESQNIMTDKHFRDWESDALGYGYGTGERPVLTTLRRFFEILKDGKSYDFQVMETEFGESTTWFLINFLIHENLVDYGTSSRFAWITERGVVLRDYMLSKTVDELCEIATYLPENGDVLVTCFPDNCQCDRPCKNPMFKKYKY